MKAVFVPRYRDDEFLRLTDDCPGVRFAVASAKQDLAREIADCRVLVIGNSAYDEDIAKILASAGKRLGLIQFSTSGVERALHYGIPAGIAASSASGVKAQSVAEHAMALILADFRSIRRAEDARTVRDWRRDELNSLCRNLEEATAVIVGFGAIGQDLARKLKAFDARVLVVSRWAAPGPNVDGVVDRHQLLQVLPQADVVVLCASASVETRHIIGARELAAMRSSALLVNVARGDLLNEDALVQSLRDGLVRAAALDVVTCEPLAADHPLWRMQNVIITPHIAGSGAGGYARFRSIFLENVRRFGAGEPLLHAIAPDEARMRITG